MKEQNNQSGKHGLRLAMTAMVVALTASAPSWAAEGPAAPAGGHGLAAFMGSYDTDRDGVVTREEYDTVRKQRFMAADTNRDGWLSEEEYVAEYEGRLKQQYAGRAQDERYAGSIKQAHVRFNILDTDRDGKLTVEEDIAIADKTFKQNDKNGDGKVDQADGVKK
ncbi:EF-hand domain-containing protein [Telluria beijingensis]|uniref:EF-hand domain-containing protein n=1 Tax=Telluria beijingensis TaxID=3068633 RepID=UPI002795FAAD|nr:hypothetical protein [Massilia sp. REN29]